MTSAHRDIGPELRKLAQSMLDGIDPALRAAAARAGLGGVGKCQQKWCPVCALAALVSGEQHPLLSAIADHSVALLSVVRSLVDDLDKPGDRSVPPPPGGAADGNGIAEPAGNGAAKSRYQPIPITVDE